MWLGFYGFLSRLDTVGVTRGFHGILASKWDLNGFNRIWIGYGGFRSGHGSKAWYSDDTLNIPKA